MYNGVKVLDVHGHVSSPEATSNYLMLMMAANTPFPSPIGSARGAGLSPEDFKRASQRHVDYIHFNPVKHGHVTRVADWPHSSFHRFVEQGLLAPDWGGDLRNIQGSFGE